MSRKSSNKKWGKDTAAGVDDYEEVERIAAAAEERIMQSEQEVELPAIDLQDTDSHAVAQFLVSIGGSMKGFVLGKIDGREGIGPIEAPIPEGVITQMGLNGGKCFITSLQVSAEHSTMEAPIAVTIDGAGQKAEICTGETMAHFAMQTETPQSRDVQDLYKPEKVVDEATLAEWGELVHMSKEDVLAETMTMKKQIGHKQFTLVGENTVLGRFMRQNIGPGKHYELKNAGDLTTSMGYYQVAPRSAEELASMFEQHVSNNAFLDPRNIRFVLSRLDGQEWTEVSEVKKKLGGGELAVQTIPTLTQFMVRLTWVPASAWARSPPSAKSSSSSSSSSRG